jgi:hypothetical protein
MSIGYEGYVKVGGIWALGTGASIPKARQRIDSTAGYGGAVSGATDMGIGGPHKYDWDNWDGSVEFELTDEVFTYLKGWITGTRDASGSIEVSSRTGNSQVFDESYWNSINISTSEASMVTGTIGFVALDRTTYAYGSDTTRSAGMVDMYDLVPIPYWSTKIGTYKFIEWSLDFSQDMVKFYACNKKAGPQGPIHTGIGPMTVNLTGSYIYGGAEMGDSPGNLTVTIGAGSIILKKTELQSISDDVLTGNALTPIKVSVDVYELA